MLKITKLIILLCLLGCFANVLQAQLFTPIVKHYNKADYKAANQNWAVAQSDNGMLYFGNNMGLLRYDGKEWELFTLPQNKTVRSILIVKNRIYVGSFEEFGYFETDEFGRLNYFSLSMELKNYDMKNDEIWTILQQGENIIFQSFTSYFTLNKSGVVGHRMPYTLLFFNLYKDQLFCSTEQIGFGYVDRKGNRVVAVGDKPFRSQVFVILQYNHTHALLVTKSDGLFLFDGVNFEVFKTEIDNELRYAEINRAAISKDGTIVLGSILNGVSAIDKNGKHLWTLNSNNILQNNTVLGMMFDRDNNLWVALDKGIAQIQTNASLRYIHAFKPSVGAIYSLAQHNGELLIGTNQGLYFARYDNVRKAVTALDPNPKIKGQVWNVTAFGQQYICGNNEETYSIRNNRIETISPVRGGICIRKAIINNKEVLVQGTYTDICIYDNTANGWQFSHTLPNFVDPIRYIEVDYAGRIWASHLYQGMYMLQLSADLKTIEHAEKFKSLDGKNESNINVFSINNRVVFTDHKAFYTYDDLQKKIIPYDELNKALGHYSKAHRVSHFKDNLYWFIMSTEAALVQVKSADIRIVDIVNYSLFLNQTVDEYQNVITVSENECIFTLENGMALYQFKARDKASKHAKLLLKSVTAFDSESQNSLPLPLSDSLDLKLKYSSNNIQFKAHYSDFNSNNTFFRYRLNGLDKLWSELDKQPTKTYNHLPSGDYVFEMELTNAFGETLDKLSYAFTVKPPIYLSKIALVIYFVLFVLLLFALYYYIVHLFQTKKEKIQREQEEIRAREIEKREKQIMALEKEKLSSELTLKSKEMAESTMTIIKKNEILAGIKTEIMKHKELLGAQYPNKYYDKLIKMLDENLSSEADWAIFQANFDRIHENFFRNLHTRYPELTSNDMRFCAYLRLNLSSKDIAHLMNISLKGVEVARYRIRKKIELPSSKSLTEFMIEFR
jgi:ligand-binding sensor domain-containing protein/DNA-binding CsgD family transcriptional regulator